MASNDHEDIIKVGNVQNPNAKKVRIVHLSDTHLRHDCYLPQLPHGDILVHSGDFAKIGWKRLLVTPNYRDHLKQMNDFFGKVPHKHKIFVGGNHDMALSIKTKEEIKTLIPNITYLQDSSVEIEGIKFHGSPWTSQKFTSYARGFVQPIGKFEHHWKLIPEDTDVLITHSPPEGLLDLSRVKFQAVRPYPVCNYNCVPQHEGIEHWGCRQLREEVLGRVR